MISVDVNAAKATIHTFIDQMCVAVRLGTACRQKEEGTSAVSPLFNARLPGMRAPPLIEDTRINTLC